MPILSFIATVCPKHLDFVNTEQSEEVILNHIVGHDVWKTYTTR